MVASDVKSSISDEDFVTLLANENADNKEDGWKRVSTFKYGEVWRQKVKSEKIMLVRSISVLPVKPKTAYEVVKDVTNRKVWDPLFLDYELVEQLDESSDVVYSSVKCPMGVKNRDWVDYRAYHPHESEENVYLAVFKSGLHPSKPDRPKFIRAETCMAGYVIRPHEEGCQIVIFNKTDVKGDIPSTLVNKQTKSSVSAWVTKFLKRCQELEGQTPAEEEEEAPEEDTNED
eukprot:GCRY01000292.1.p1 GENE.GCRY01000292.1~~GCRY01000292.1.p1  ORF type:complete len:231 (-),score=32.49 GCRY01000292.1:203-895(-)